MLTKTQLLISQVRVVSCSNPEVVYFVHDAAGEWASCTCAWSEQGNLCKHQVKCLILLEGKTEDQIVQVCGSLVGTSRGGLEALFSQDNQDSLQIQVKAGSDWEREERK